MITFSICRYTVKAPPAMPRMMKMIADYSRIVEGKPVVSGAVDIAGLAPKEAMYKTAREVFVDYGALNPKAKELRDLFFPFATFYTHNAKNWAKHPVEYQTPILYGAIGRTGPEYRNLDGLAPGEGRQRREARPDRMKYGCLILLRRSMDVLFSTLFLAAERTWRVWLTGGAPGLRTGRPATGR